MDPTKSNLVIKTTGGWHIEHLHSEAFTDWDQDTLNQIVMDIVRRATGDNVEGLISLTWMSSELVDACMSDNL